MISFTILANYLPLLPTFFQCVRYEAKYLKICNILGIFLIPDTFYFRLSNLPPYVKKPKPRKTISELSEHASLLPLEGGIQHWIVMATAQKRYTDSENSVLRAKASSVLPENVHVWDHLDAATKLSQYPLLAKVFLNMPNGVVLRPAKEPPTREDVRNWMNEEKRKSHKTSPVGKLSKTMIPKVKSSLKKSLVDDGTLISPKSSLRRSSSFSSPSKRTTPRPRRVSFEVASRSSQDELKINTRKRALKSIIGSPNKSFESKALKSTQTSTSPTQGLVSPFATGLSPVTPTTDKKDIWDSKLLDDSNSNQSPGTCDGGSSAIRSLVGSSNPDDDPSITSIVSGSFTPVAKIIEDNSSSTPYRDASMKKQPQSTPNTAKPYRRRAHKKLSYTPTTQTTGDTGRAKSISPISAKSTTFTKSATLQKAVLIKNIPKHGSDGSLPEKGSLGDSVSPSPTESPPLSLNTPCLGKKEGSQIDGPTLDNTYGFKAPQQHLGDAKSLHIIQHITVVSGYSMLDGYLLVWRNFSMILDFVYLLLLGQNISKFKLYLF